MEKSIKISIKGINYVSSPELETCNCAGCDLRGVKPSCPLAGDVYDNFQFGRDCYDNSSIFILESTELYTVSEVINAIASCNYRVVNTYGLEYTDLDAAIANVSKYLQRESDPEYVEFMRLKKIYE